MSATQKSRNKWIARIVFLITAGIMLALGLFIGFSPVGLIVFTAAPLVVLGAIEGFGYYSEHRTPKPESKQHKVSYQGLNAEGEIVLPVGVEEIPGLLERAVPSLNRFTVTTLNRDSATIRAGMSLWSAGVMIYLKFEPAPSPREAGGGTVVRASTEPLVRTAVSDFGQGERDINSLFTRLEELCEARQH